MMTACLYLPWPDKRLNPNARMHWAALAKAKKKAKTDAYHIALEAGIGKIDAEKVSAKYTFFPPDRRTRDRDNLIGCCKALQDGLALAIGVDDGSWVTTYEIAGTIEKNGMVKVNLEWEQTA